MRRFKNTWLALVQASFFVSLSGCMIVLEATPELSTAQVRVEERLEIYPVIATLPLGAQRQFVVTHIRADGTQVDVTTSVNWSSASSALSISNTNPTKGIGTAAQLGSSTVTASFGGLSTSASITISESELVSIEVTPSTPSLAKGLTQTMTAMGVYSDSTIQNLTSTVSWSSSATSIATISNASGTQGVVSAQNAGSAVLTASLGAISGSTTLTVTAATLVSVAVTPTNPSIAKGLTQAFTATGTYTDSSTQNITSAVTWSSSSTGIATVSNASGSHGITSSLAVGSTTITATLGALSATSTLIVTSAELVSIDVTPGSPIVPLGNTRQFTATGIYTDASTQNLTSSVTWSSSSGAIASISNAAGSKGLATTLATGSSTMSASLGAVSGSSTLTVSAAELVSIGVSPSSQSVAKGLTHAFTATGTYTDNTTQNLTSTVTWSSSNTGISTISNAAGSQGLASTLGVGSATITATLGAIQGTSSLTVTAATLVSLAISPSNPSVALGLTQQYTATGTYTDSSTADLTTSVTWASSHPAKAPISNAVGSKGLLSTVAMGSVSISATLGAVTSNSSSVTITAAALVSIAVTPLDPWVNVGSTRSLQATGTYSDSSTLSITDSVTWSSVSTGVATVSNVAGSRGVVTGVAAGSSNVIAELSGVQGSVTVTARNPVAITRVGSVVTSAGTENQISSLNVALPAGLQDGDLVIIGLTRYGWNAGSLVIPSGWVSIRSITTGDLKAELFKKVWRTGDATTASFSYPGAWSGALSIAYRNAVDVEGSQTATGASGGVYTSGTQTAGAADWWQVSFFITNTDYYCEFPSGGPKYPNPCSGAAITGVQAGSTISIASSKGAVTGYYNPIFAIADVTQASPSFGAQSVTSNMQRPWAVISALIRW